MGAMEGEILGNAAKTDKTEKFLAPTKYNHGPDSINESWLTNAKACCCGMFDHRESGRRPQEALVHCHKKTKIPKTRVTRKTRKILFRKAQLHCIALMEGLMKTRLVIVMVKVTT